MHVTRVFTDAKSLVLTIITIIHLPLSLINNIVKIISLAASSTKVQLDGYIKKSANKSIFITAQDSTPNGSKILT